MLKIFSKPNCPACVQLKNFLKYKQVPYTELDITPKLQDFWNLGLRSAPVVEINGNYLSGVKITDVWTTYQNSLAS